MHALPKDHTVLRDTQIKKQVGLGTYDDLDEAIRARKDAEQQYGFHGNHGR